MSKTVSETHKILLQNLFRIYFHNKRFFVRIFQYILRRKKSILFFRLVLFNLVQNRQDLLPVLYNSLTSQIFNFNFKFPNIFTVFLTIW